MGADLWRRGFDLLQHPDGTPWGAGNAFFNSTIVHEYNHAMFNRLMGFGVSPAWFKEVWPSCAGRGLSQLHASRQKMLLQLLASDALVSPDALADTDAFTAQHRNRHRGAQRQKRGRARPYLEGWGLTRYFLDHTSTAQLQSFLTRVRQSNDFNRAFQDEFGVSVTQFYYAGKPTFAANSRTRPR